jgi:hypothetical protein
VSVSSASKKLIDNRDVGPDRFISDWLTVVTYGHVQRIGGSIEPLRQDRQSDSFSCFKVICEHGESFGNVTPARERCVLKFILEPLQCFAEVVQAREHCEPIKVGIC